MFGDDNGESGSLGSRFKGRIAGRATKPAPQSAEVIPFGDPGNDEGGHDAKPVFSVDPDWPIVTGGWVHSQNACGMSPEEVRSRTMGRVGQMRTSVRTHSDRLFLAALYELLGERNLGLPDFPETPIRLDQLLKEEEPNSLQVMRCIEADPQLVGRVWQRARSARFPSAPSSLDMAVSRIGMVEVWRLSLESALDTVEIRPGQFKDLSHRVRVHGAIVGNVTAGLAGQRRGPAFLCGLLHNVGKIVLLQVASQVDPELTTVRRVMKEFQTDISVLVADAWRLSPEIIPAVATHHDPNRARVGKRDLSRFLCLANIATYGELDRRQKKNSQFLHAMAKITQSRAVAGKSLLLASQCIDRMEADGLIFTG